MKYHFGSTRLALLLAAAFIGLTISVMAAPIRVLVWDERQEAQKTAYDGHYLGDTLAAYLAQQPGLVVKSTGLNEPEQGLSESALNNCDVLVWWGHQKHYLVADEHVQAILERLKKGKLGLVALHSAHWSKPFIAAMNTRAIDDALQSIPKSERGKVKIVQVPAKHDLTHPNDELTPSFKHFTSDDGVDTLEVHLPSCVFSYVNASGDPSHITTYLPKHPIAKGIPATFDIPHTEIYAGHFCVPKPDAMIFGEKWDNGREFTSGCAWQVEKGRVFYFRPGHETFSIFKQPIPLKIVVNAIHWVRP